MVDFGDILELCETFPEVCFEAGETIVEEGNRGSYILVLIEGSVQVSKHDYEINTVSAPGSIFGEMSLLLDRSHTATLRALADSRFYVIDDALKVIEESPKLNLHVACLLAMRLDCLNVYLADLKAQFKEHQDHFAMVDEVLDSLSHQQIP